MPHYDLVLKSGTIVDGTQFPRYVADIGISNGRIEKIGPPGDHTATREIDAEGRIVAPGVIDPHTHYDAPIHWDPYCTSSSWHGCTTVAVGNCGFGFSPCLPADRERYMLMRCTRTKAWLCFLTWAVLFEQVTRYSCVWVLQQVLKIL